ncbi:MAG: peroxiredoxin family protein [Lutibacter sp.]|uniref:peroxiredoxin family protein n=1 Tax=Lutibacter sp. TaxID=1925666 RepID=UPI0038585E85
MKKIIILSVLFISLLACKNNKEIKEVKTIKPLETAKNIDYAVFGMNSEYLPKGLKVGSLAPQITMTTDENEIVKLKDFYKNQPLVIIFYRGYWCPVCNKHLSEFAVRAKEIENRGAKLIAISSESYENVDKTRDKTNANFTIISDIDGSIMKAFDVNYNVTNEYQKMILEKLNASIAKTNATNNAVLPVPATYIINTNGKIVYKQFNPNYKVRASIEDILNNLPK